jgi:hypothetical protein
MLEKGTYILTFVFKKPVFGKNKKKKILKKVTYPGKVPKIDVNAHDCMIVFNFYHNGHPY